MATQYDIIDRDSRTVAEIPSVLTPVTLTSVETSSGSNLVTVGSTTGLFPGMPVAIPGVPMGAFIHAIKSSTVIELWRSVWDASTGVWTTSAASANATATASSLTGHAFGYHPFCILEQTYALGMWRNLHSSNPSNGLASLTAVSTTGSTQVAAEYSAHHTYGNGVAIIPSAGSVSGGVYTMSSATVQLSDTLMATPVKRHNGEKWGVRPFIQTGGLVSHVPARPDWSVICSSLS